MKTKEKNRKHYKKPQVSQIKLEIEEAVLSNCKTVPDDPSGVGNKWCGHNQCKGTFGS